jgi:hypothetical protein
VALADGNQASVGDVIITRSNDRRLRLTVTDWVRNGDRTITQGGDQHGRAAQQAISPLRCLAAISGWRSIGEPQMCERL